MKLYLVLYFVGKTIFTLGPYPDGADAVCISSAAELQEKARDHWDEFQKLVDVPTRAMDLIAECIMTDERPKIEDDVPYD